MGDYVAWRTTLYQTAPSPVQTLPCGVKKKTHLPQVTQILVYTVSTSNKIKKLAYKICIKSHSIKADCKKQQSPSSLLWRRLLMVVIK